MATPAYLKAFRDYLDSELTFSNLPAMEIEFYAGSDRPAVILQVSNTENILQKLIETKMRPDLSNDLRDRIFNGNGALSNFSAKISVGFALGLFGPIFRHDLDIVRELRNGFAHATHPLVLTIPAVAGMCANLQLPDHQMGKQPVAYSTLYPDITVAADSNHPRTRFTVACHTLALYMIENVHGAMHTLP